MTHQTPFHQFKKAIADKLISAGLFNADWFTAQQEKINRYWLAGESVESAYRTIKILAEAQQSNDYFRHPSKARLAHAGCEFN